MVLDGGEVRGDQFSEGREVTSLIKKKKGHAVLKVGDEEESAKLQAIGRKSHI